MLQLWPSTENMNSDRLFSQCRVNIGEFPAKISQIAIANSEFKNHPKKQKKRKKSCHSEFTSCYICKKRNVKSLSDNGLCQMRNFLSRSNFLHIGKEYIGKLTKKETCHACYIFNMKKRHNRVNLQGYVSIVTGGRIKIGYEIALKLLRDGSFVIVTTRFPIDAINRYKKEKDYHKWKNHLQIYKLDLKKLNQVHTFIQYCLTNLKRLDILINNAAQTIQRPQAYYRDLLINENKEYISDWNIKHRIINFKSLDSEENQLSIEGNYRDNIITKFKDDQKDAEVNNDFPLGKFDSDGQQLDLRKMNGVDFFLKTDQNVLKTRKLGLVDFTSDEKSQIVGD